MYAMLFTIFCIFIISKLIDAFNTSYIVDESNNRNELEGSYQQGVQETSSQVPSDKWITTAIKDIAYYLREHKFNEWDRRYYQDKPDENILGFIGLYPNPPLKTLHWQVKENCHINFYTCITYLNSIVETAPYSRVEDIAVGFNEHYNSLNETNIKRLNSECKERHMFAEKVGLPFDEPIEKFQWRSTASYYMCWFTMLGIPALSMIEEPCDNFANCLDSEFISHNHDPRADDKLSFACAMYSFCPDPCCPIKYIKSIENCLKDKRNPCFKENIKEESIQRKCQIDRKLNQKFKDIVSNKWNITCNCKHGFVWKSKYGICVDINECLTGVHDCNAVSQYCFNLPGTFICICKMGFDRDKETKICIKRNSTFVKFE